MMRLIRFTVRSKTDGPSFRITHCCRRTPNSQRILSTSGTSKSSQDGEVQKSELLGRSPSQSQQDHSYCVNLVRERDREGYLCGLLAPAGSKQALFAIRAFNVELASIKDGSNLRRSAATKSTGTTIALQMRMQWWREALSEIFRDDDRPVQSKEREGDTRSVLSNSISISCWHSPVVRELYRAHLKSNFTRRFLERLVDAREYDLELSQFATLQDLIAYSEQTSSSLLYLALECSGVRDGEADTVASYAGIAVGLTTSLRSTPFRLLHGEVPLPAELFPPGFSYESMLRALSSDEGFAEVPADAAVWKDAAQYVAHEAISQLSEAQRLHGLVPKAGRASLLQVIPASHYLEQLQKADYNVFDSSLVQQNPKSRLLLMFLLARSWITGVF